jgi:putative addiction module component (TIGR02574 family)
MDIETVIREVETWPAGDRIRLVNELWDRLVDQGYEPEIDDELKAELDRRAEEMRANPEIGIPWEIVKARLDERFGA